VLALAAGLGSSLGALAAIAALLAIPSYPLLAILIFAMSLWIVDGSSCTAKTCVPQLMTIRKRVDRSAWIHFRAKSESARTALD
jgi:hypothetical protein